jgi:hypothetical protein
MTCTFKVTITPSLLQIIQKHPIGKGIAELTGFDIESILAHCSLDVPDESLLGAGWVVMWTADDLDIQAENFHSIQVLLKLFFVFTLFFQMFF